MKKISYHGQELLPIKSDIVFKVVFGKPENRDILAKFVSALLDIDIESPESIELLNNELSPDFSDGKMSRFDLRAKLSDGTHIEIEIQLNNEYNMIPRALYYHAKLYHSQLFKNMNYKELSRAVTLNILDYDLLDEENYLNKYLYCNTVSGNQLSDLCEINFLELKKVPQKWYNEREMWSLFLATDSEEVIDVLADNNEDIGKTVEKLKYVTADEQERYRIDQIEKARFDHDAAMKNRYLKGLSEGMEQGIEQGKEAMKIEMARNLLQILDNQEIANISGLDVDFIQKLRKEQ